MLSHRQQSKYSIIGKSSYVQNSACSFNRIKRTPQQLPWPFRPAITGEQVVDFWPRTHHSVLAIIKNFFPWKSAANSFSRSHPTPEHIMLQNESVSKKPKNRWKINLIEGLWRSDEGNLGHLPKTKKNHFIFKHHL